MRWTVIAYYITDAGMVDFEYQVEELIDMHSIVERGPSWYTLDRIEVRLTNPVRMTIEEAVAK